jgi:hypothetical protein
MPNGGTFGSGTGLQLQANTPGIADTGNFNITGRGITHNGLLPTRKPVNYSMSDDHLDIDIGGAHIITNDSTNAIYENVNIGYGSTIRSRPSGILNTAILIGYTPVVYGSAAIVIGYQARSGDPVKADAFSSTAANVVIGNQAQAYMQNSSISSDFSTVVGNGAGELAATAKASTIVGRGCTSNNATGLNLIFGLNQTTTGTNNILVGAHDSGPDAFASSNTISIGNSSHTTISLGPILFNKPTITGSSGGNAALADLLTKLAAMNLIIDTTTA